jgi:CRP-like cAMP-binding protein
MTTWPTLGALAEPDVDALNGIGTQERLHVSDQLLTEGTHHDAIYLALDGELSVSVKGRNAAIAYVGKGEIVGEMSLLESQPASATLCAITPVTALRIPRDALEENLAADLLLWLRDRYPNDTDEELTKRFRDYARDHLAIVDRLSDFFLGLNFNRLLRPARAPKPQLPEENESCKSA